MAVAMKVKAQPRGGRGTSMARRLRRSGTIPAVVYGVGKKPQNVEVNTRDFTRGLHTHTSEHVMLDLEIGEGDVRKVLLQEVQHHAVTGDIIHADFHEISMTHKLRVKVPLKLVGDAVGVTQMGGVLEHLMREIEVECLPLDIPEHIDLDVAALNVGDGLKAGDIKLDTAKFRLVTDKDLAVAAVSAQRAEEVVAPVTAAAGAAEPEVLREKKPEDGEAAAGDAKPGAKDAKGGAKGDAKPAAGAKDAKPAAGAKGDAKPGAKK